MQIALWGKGKTGSQVLKHHDPALILGPFGKSLTPSIEDLDKADIILLFLPGSALQEHLELLLKTKTPIVSGCTGFNFDEDFKTTIKNNNKIWVQANNFSIFMMCLKKIIEYVGTLQNILPKASWALTEIHHTQKLDAPSGTALTWQKWLGQEVPIESIRQGDEIGTHTLDFKDDNELIRLEHRSLNRDLFAKGALYACELTLELQLKPNFYEFDQLIDLKLKGTRK